MHLCLLKGRFSGSGGLPMMYLVEATMDFKCSDSRDRIFALLGLLPEDERACITTDYNSSPCEVFCNAIWVMALDNDPAKAVKVTEVVDLWKDSTILGD
jgi:hypothetical protein